MGCDDFHIRGLGWLSAELLSAFVGFFATIEGLGLWPAQLQGILVPLIPKADGGRRPIGKPIRIRKPIRSGAAPSSGPTFGQPKAARRRPRRGTTR